MGPASSAAVRRRPRISSSQRLPVPESANAGLEQRRFHSGGGGLGDYNPNLGTVNGVNNLPRNDGPVVEARPTLAAVGGFTVVTSWTGRLTLMDIVDGTSSTLFFGEKHIRPNSMLPTRGFNEDRSIFGGQNNSTRRCAGHQARPAKQPGNGDRDLPTRLSAAESGRQRGAAAECAQ